MGDVAIRLKVLPSGADTNLGRIKDELNKMGAKEIREQPIAFGLKLIDVLFVLPDKEGSNLEEKIQKIPGVGSVETESITLI
jgi:translation elongation factor aEF-1 beta